jgi:hypothetical protein
MWLYVWDLYGKIRMGWKHSGFGNTHNGHRNAIDDVINFFGMDALPCTVPLRIDLELQLILIASTLYQVFAHRLAPRY